MSLVERLTSTQKLRFLLLQQFVYAGGTIVMLLLVLVSQSELAVALAVLLGVALTRLTKPWEKKLRDTNVWLTMGQKHAYFAIGMIYFYALVGALLAWAIRHSSPPVWAAASLGFIVLLVTLYAAMDQTYGRNAKL